MVEILFPAVPDPPTLDIDSGVSFSVAPGPHVSFVEDYEYYDSFGRDPFQQYRIWLISDPAERVAMVQRVLRKLPKQKHRRQMLFAATLRNDEAIVRCLVDTGLNVHPEMQQTQGKMNDAADEGSDDGIPDIDDETVIPLHVAASKGLLNCVKIFIESGAGVEVRDEMGRTPLVAAAHGGRLDVMRYLLDVGADPTATTYTDEPIAKELLGHLAGAGALEMAATHGSVEALELVFEAIKKKTNDQDGDLKTSITPLALMTAAIGGIDAFKLLLEKAGYPTEDKHGKTKAELLSEIQRRALVDATPSTVEDGSLECMKLLLSYQYPTDKDGNFFPFEVPEELRKPFVWGAYAAMNGQPDKFDFIHSLGIKEHETMSLDHMPEGQSWNIQHLLEKAVELGSIDCVRLMVEKYGANPNKTRMPPCVQPLYIAAGNNKTDMVRHLLEIYKPDIHLASGRYATGPTALWIAIRLKNLDSIALLLQHGGPLDHIDDDILTINQPTSAILRATSNDHNRPVVRLELWSPEQEHFEATHGDFLNRNPPYVRVRLEPENDMTWIRDLQYRRSAEELREQGDPPRFLDETEEDEWKDRNGELAATDVRQTTVELPTYEWRNEELNEKDADLIPEFRSWLKVVG